LDNEEYAKWEKLDQQNRAKRIHNNKVYLEAERPHRKNQTVTTYFEWKKIEIKRSSQVGRALNHTETWKVYKEISNDGWTKYKLKKEDAREGYDAVRDEYKRVKRLFNHLTDPCDWPFWKKATCLVGTAIAAPVTLVVLVYGLGYLTGEMDKRIKSEVVGSVLKEILKEEL
jgi:hypothetical protein